MEIRWIAVAAALVVVAAAPALVEPAEAVVRTFVADAATYAAGSSMVLSGTTSENRGTVQLRFYDSNDRVTDCITTAYCATPRILSNSTFKFAPIPVDDAFASDGMYTLKAHSGSQREADAKILLISKSGDTVTVLGGMLEIRSISRKSVSALSELTFTAQLEGSSTGITFSLKDGTTQPGMRITSAGAFSWTPIPSEVSGRVYTVTIVATGQGQTAEKNVEISVTARQQASDNGVRTVTTDKTTYSRTESITFSGTSMGSFSGDRVKIEIWSPSSSSVPSQIRDVLYGTRSADTFTFSPHPAAGSFNVDGEYTVRTYMESQSSSDAHLSYMTKTGSSITFDGSRLELGDIPRQNTVAGSRVAFLIPVTDPSFTNLDYSLTTKPSGATINDDGVFTWTPRAADAGTTSNPRTHTVTVRVESGSGSNAPVATKDVIIAVAPALAPPTPPAGSGGQQGATPPASAAPGESSDSSRVLTIATDAASYSRDDRITFSGTTQGATAREIVSVVIEPPSGSSKIRSGLTTATNVFTLSPIDVRDAFGREGIYTIKAFTNPQGASNAATIMLQYENSRVTRYFETPLTLASITPKSVELGSTLSFTVAPTASSYTDLTWSLGGSIPPGATISRAGVFEWTPESLRNAQGESFQVRIMATDGTQTAGAMVMVSVTPRAEPEPEPPAPEPEPTPPPEPRVDPMEEKRTSFLATVQGAEPQSLIDRYENEQAYREWYDSRFEGLDIREALGVGTVAPPPAQLATPPPPAAPAGPDPRFASSMDQGDDPQTYVDRYNDDPSYRAWFDTNFPDLTIQQAVGLGAPAPAPVPDPRFASSMNQGDDPQTYVDRYNDDAAYREWFDSNFEGLTIQQAVGLAPTAPAQPAAPAPAPEPEPDPEPHPDFVRYMTQGDDPQVYVDRYNTDAGYKGWFDSNFPDLTIQQAAGLGSTSLSAAAPVPEPDPEPHPDFVQYMTQGDDPQVYVDRYNDDAAYRSWFDDNFEGLTIQQAAGLGSAPAAAPAPAPAPAPEPDPEPHPDFVPYMTDGDDPFTYVHRYNTDPPYADWFDMSFPDLTIEEATGYVEPEIQPCVPGTELVDGVCTPIKATPVPKPAAGGCLIATAAYGTELAPQVQALREIRDSGLLATGSGSSFMAAFNAIYYSFSPTVADWERQSPELRAAVRALITPMLATLPIMSLAGDSEAGVLALGIAVIALNAGIYVAAPVGAALAVRSAARRRAARLVRKVGFEPTNP